nr:discoidin domain-containing protein [Pedobacter sp. ASV19]
MYIKNIKNSFLIWPVFLLAFSACKKNTSYTEETDSKANAAIFVAKANTGLQNLNIFPYSDDARTFKFNAQYGALGLPANPINVTFEVDSRAFDSLNVIRKNNGLALYEKFPADAYTLDNLNVSIPQGDVSSNFVTLKYFSRKFDSAKDYLLPISIKNASGYFINPTVKTILIVAPKLAETLASKTGWTATADTEELTGEGAVNGRAGAAIDGDISTYWHSMWSGSEPPYPHWLIIDMKKENFVTRVDLAPRQNNSNGFIRFDLEGSTDNTNWVSLGKNLTMDPVVKTFQRYPITPASYRYIRITMLEARTAAAKSTHLAEVNVYKY